MNHTTTAEPYHVQLFGGPKLFRGSEEISLSPLQGAIIGLLFGRDDSNLDRDKAVSILWPDEESVPARHRLSQHLYTLRSRIGKPGILEARKHEIRQLSSGVTCDLKQFKEALQTLDLIACSALLKKQFLPSDPGFEGRRYTDWSESRGAEVRQEFRAAAERQWRICSQEERWEEACIPAEALLGLYPDAEDRLQSVMEARIKAGRPVEAEEAFQEFAALQRKENWTPDSRTNALMEGVQTKLTEVGRDGPREVGLGLPEPPLLGRNEERTLLRKALRTAPRRELRGVLISGEAGIGKTRLINEALHGLPIDGQRIFSAQSAELERLIPLNPLIEALARPGVGDVLRDLDEPWRTVLYGVMPRHFPGDGPIPEAPHIQPGSVPRRLFEAFYQLLLSLVREGPVTLVLEDLQWTDDTTLSVLDFLVRASWRTPESMWTSTRSPYRSWNPRTVRR
jgi:DNA-binding SARP family transcriptional activator